MSRSQPAHSFRFYSRTAAAFAIVVGTTVLIGGWVLDVARLRSFFPGLATMKFNTAVALASCGAAFWLLQPAAQGWRRHVGRAFAAAAILIGALTLMEYAFDWNIGIDEWLFADTDNPAANVLPGRPSPNGALAIVLIGFALLFLDGENRNGRRLAERFAFAAACIALVGLLGHLYGAQGLYGIAAYSSLALHSALVLLVLAIGVLAARPDRCPVGLVGGAGSGGIMARHMLPAAFFIPPVLGWIQLAGEHAGLYRYEFGLAMFASANVIVITAIVWRNAEILNAADLRRWYVKEELRRNNEELEARVAQRTAELALANDILRREISEREHAEARFRGLLKSAPDAIVIVDGEGRIALASEQAEKWFGYTRDELHGQNIEMLVPESLRGTHRVHRAGYIAAPRTRYMGRGLELYGRRKDGSEFPVEISLSPVQTDDGMFVTTIIRDISEHKSGEQARAELQARFQAVVETANDAVVSADGSGDIIYFNPAAERIFGYSAAEAAGQPLTLLMPGRFRAAHRDGLARLLAGGAARVVGKTVELAGRRKDGVEFSLELSLASWNVGERTFFTGVLRDITARIQAEELLRNYAAQLETTNRELESFSYSVSHDLRAPLRAIDGFSHVLLDDYADKLDAEGRDYLNRVRAAAQRMALLIDDLIKLSSVTRSELNIAEWDLSRLIADIAQDLRDREPQRRVEISIVPELRARGDMRLLRIALGNLLDNAWKFTGGRNGARIEFGRMEQEGKQVYLVRDNGAGFDMAYAGRLFGAFQRLHDQREFPGTGIGLATVQRVIHKHGGRIWAEGVVGRGATFYFTL